MKRGKKICGELKKIRRRIVDENGIEMDIPECTYEGECRGTCPRCEWEVKYLEKTLFERMKLGKIATISGLALTLSSCNGGGGIGPDIQVVGDVPNTDTENVVSETIPPPPPEPILDLPICGDVVELDGVLIEMPPANALKQEKDTIEDDFVEGEMPMPEIEIFISTEEMPEFPGGEQAMYDFLAKNISYPKTAKDSNIKGNVYVQFVVEKDGTITNPKVLRDVGGGCGDEALRVVRMMPKWKPGMHKGKAVRVQYTLPFHFRLEE